MKVYYDKELIKGEYLSFLAPLLGVPNFPIRGEDAKQISTWYESNPNIQFVTPEESDYFVFPRYFLLDDFDDLRIYNNIALSYNKKVIVFSYGEIDDYFPISDNIIWYKRSTLQSNPENEYCLPAFPEDLGIYNTYPHLPQPYSISFVGYSDFYDIKSYIRYKAVRTIGIIARTKLIKRLLFSHRKESLYNRLVSAGSGNHCRGKTIRILQKSSTYKLNFLQRNKALTSDTTGDMRSQYVNHLINNHFSLTVRGFGNYSIRLYEVISLGKIPLYIDTGAKLPCSDEIPYNDLFIIVPFQDVNNIEHYIDEFIIKNGDRLDDIQKTIRMYYDSHLSMKGFYNHIIAQLSK